MKKVNKTKIFFLIFGLFFSTEFLIFIDFIKAKPLSNKKLISKSYLLENPKEITKLFFQNPNISPDSLISNLIPKGTKENKESKFLNIESDIQYQTNDTFYAQGDVVVYLENAELKADSISLDKNTNLFKADGNIIFNKGDQYLEASRLEYNLSSNKGFIVDAYGVIDISKFPTDLNIQTFTKESTDEKDNFNDLPKNLKLLSSSSLGYQNKKFNFDFPQITKWRFKSKLININEDFFTSDLIFFTNDPYNKPQFVLESKNFIGEILSEEEIKLKSKSTFLRFEDFIRLPIGRRTIQDAQSKLRWGFGYDSEEKDGFYVFRNNDPIKFGNYKLNLRTQYFLQRYLNEETNAFRLKKSPLNSGKIKQKSDLFDSLGLNANLIGSFFDYDLELNANIESLSFDRINESVSSDLLLQKGFYEKKYKDPISTAYSKTSSGLALYGTYNQDDIHTSFGARVINNHDFLKKSFAKNNNLVFDVGNYYAASSDNTRYLNLNRYGVLGSLSYSYDLLSFKDKNKIYTEAYKFSPNIIDEGLSFNASLSSGFYAYSNSTTQGSISLSYGPTLIIGETLNPFFDYTTISLRHDIIAAGGKSPYSFDQFEDSSRLRLSIQQRILGPLILAYDTKYNLDTGNFYDNIYTLNLKRRAYSFGLFYDQTEKQYGFKFSVFNFGYKGNSTKF